VANEQIIILPCCWRLIMVTNNGEYECSRTTVVKEL